jgi:hypothetical protein
MIWLSTCRRSIGVSDATAGGVWFVTGAAAVLLLGEWALSWTSSRFRVWAQPSTQHRHIACASQPGNRRAQDADMKGYANDVAKARRMIFIAFAGEGAP